MTSKPQFIAMEPGDKVILEAQDNCMLVECQKSRSGSVLLYRPPTEREKQEMNQ